MTEQTQSSGWKTCSDCGTTYFIQEDVFHRCPQVFKAIPSQLDRIEESQKRQEEKLDRLLAIAAPYEKTVVVADSVPLGTLGLHRPILNN